MSDVIHQTDNTSTGIVIGVLAALAVAAGAYFYMESRNSGPEVSINLPNASATLDIDR